MNVNKKAFLKKYDRVMPRVYNQSKSSSKLDSFVTRHKTPSSVLVGGKTSVSNISSGVFSDLPTVLNDFKVESCSEMPVKRSSVVRPRRTLKSLDPALSPPRSVPRSQEQLRKPFHMRARSSAPSVLTNKKEKLPITKLQLESCSTSKSLNTLREIKDEIQAYHETEKLMRLRSQLYRRCGVMLDDTGQVASDKAVQVDTPHNAVAPDTESDPYGDECPVTKNECVGHVQKRMGTRLRTKRKDEKLGGKKRLTEALIKKLTIYYGLAIRRNLNSVEDMRNAIMATLDHYCSTDKLPRHDKCPEGVESWCEWRKAEATNTLAAFKHPPRVIDKHVEKHIRPVYEDLSKDDLLTRCLGGHTQNANESFNSTVWRIVPKHLNSGIKIVEIAAYIAGGMFNEGYSAVLKTMQLLDLKIGQQCNNFTKGADKERINRQNRRDSLESKEARTARRLEHLGENQFFEESQGPFYGPGIAD